MIRLDYLGLVSAAIWAAVAFATMLWGHYEISAVAFILVALSIYVFEVKRDA